MNKRYIVRQNDIKDCGICCLESIIKYYNGYIPMETLRLDTKTNNKGTTAYNIIKTAKKYGFNAIGKKNLSLNSKELILPAIAHIVTDKGLNHFVVIYKITKKEIHLMDPAKGYVKKRIKDFEKNWTNIILVFKPFKQIPLYKTKNNLKELFFQVISSQKNLVFKIIVTNILITFISIAVSYYFKFVISSTENNYINSTFFIILIFLILNIFKLYFNYMKNNLSIYLNKNIDLLIIPEFINHIFKLPLNVINSRTSGEILTRIRSLNNIKDLFSEIAITVVLDSFLTICSVFFLYYISDKLFFILCIIALLYVIVGMFSNNIIIKKLNDNIDLETDFNSLLSEKVDSLESIKNLNIVNKEINVLEESYSEYQENTFMYSQFMNNLLTVKNTINDIGQFVINSYGIYLIIQNKISLLTLITFNTLLSYFLEPIENTIDLFPKFQLIKLSINKVSEFLNVKTEKLGKEEHFSKGNIAFKDISYTYDDYHYIIKNLSLSVKHNSHSIIKGGTGSGKSTLCKMINRNIDDYQGNIFIDGINIKDYSLTTLRKNILYVSQRERIFNDTILNNITLNKNVTKEELNKILKITKVDEIIDKKSLRLDSILYDEGFNLSGGERQRIILARSILIKPSILILDESLSETDKETETYILSNLDEYMKNTTIIYISHTNTNCFKDIIEMDDINET